MNERVVSERPAALPPADVDAVEGPSCGGLLGPALSVCGAVDAIEARITSRVRQLHNTAGGAPADGRRPDRRSATIPRRHEHCVRSPT